MKQSKIILILFTVLSLFLSVTVILAETVNNKDSNSGAKDIRDRLGNDDLYILDTSDIIFTDDEGNVIDDPTINSKVNIRFDWSLENNESILIEDGDYYTFKLPDTFKITTEMTGFLGEYGTFIIAPGGNVTFIFNELVGQSSNVNGYIEFSARLNEEIIDNPGEIIITLPINEESEFKFNVTPTVKDTSIEKEGSFDKELNPEYITWEVKINKAYETLTGVSVIDDIPAGLTLDHIEVYPLNLNHDGTFKSYGEELSDSFYGISDSTVTFNDAINQPYAIRYITRIDDANKPNDGGELEFLNHARMESNENEEITTDAPMIASYGKLLTKTKPAYNATEQSFTWTVQYNYGEKTIENPRLVDIFDENLEYVEGTLVITDLNDQPVEYDYSLTNNPTNQLEIQFNESVSKALKISYKTKVKEGKLILENEDFENSISSGDVESGNTGTAQPRMIIKSSPEIDYQNKYITWAVDVNVNQYQMSNYSITDSYLYGGLELLESSFEIYDVTLNKWVDSENYELVKTFSGSTETGFTLSFTGQYATTSNRLRISYKTAYDVNDLTAGNGSVFRNHAKLTWTDQYNSEHSHSSQADRSINYQTINNGQKSGNYNAQTKEITWKVDVNYNSETLSNAKVTDKIQDGQKYVNGSLVIKTYTVNRDGTLSLSGQADDLSQFNVTYPSEENSYTLSVSLPDESDLKYSIEFRTSISSEAIKTNYQNRAVFSNDTYTRFLDASVTITNGQKFVTKTGNQEGSLIHWSIAINESQSTIKDAELHDNPSSNQILLEESFKLYPVTVQPNETYQTDYDNPLTYGEDYTLVISTDEQGKQSFVLKFTNEIHRTYVLEYDSQISTTPDNTAISNIVTLNGNQISYEDGNGGTSVVIDVNSAGGGAVGVKGSLTIQKVDEYGNPLEGVEFELYNPLNRKVATRLTDENGKIVFSGLVYGNYIIKETQALEGYVIENDLLTGKSIEVNGVTTDPDHVVIFENRMNQLKIIKLDRDGQQLSGAIFELQQLVNDSYVTVNNNISVNNGSVILYGLEAGKYRLNEVEAPSGYIRNLTSLEFDISVNEYEQELDLTIEFVNYQGSVKLTKTDSDNQLLEGVIYDLYDANDQLIIEDLVTDESGEILIENALAPGNYYFKEKSSVDGNIVNETPLNFVITEAAEGEPSVVEVRATNFKGSVEFKKTDQYGIPLAGVEFNLYIQDDNDPYAVVYSDENGIVHIDHLAPGYYTFKETSAKDGYILNTESIDFVIPETTSDDAVLIELDDFINYQGTFKIEKIDASGQLLNGAQFKLQNNQGDEISVFTAEDGIAVIDRLEPGVYTLIEIVAPSGYLLDNQVIEIVIPEEYDGTYEFATIQVVNELLPKKQEEMPSTGVSDVFTYVSLALIGLGICLLAVNRKKKEYY